MTVVDDVFAAVTYSWESSTQIWKRAGCWQKSTVQKRLNLLADKGDIERKSARYDSRNTVMLFRRKPPAS